MKIKTTEQIARITVHADVTGAGPIAHPYAPKKIIPERLTVQYRGAEGVWVADSIRIRGAYAKKNGQPGVQVASVTAPYRWQELPDWAWLVRVVGLLRPTSRVTLTDAEFEVEQ